MWVCNETEIKVPKFDKPAKKADKVMNSVTSYHMNKRIGKIQAVHMHFMGNRKSSHEMYGSLSATLLLAASEITWVQPGALHLDGLLISLLGTLLCHDPHPQGQKSASFIPT